MASDAWKKHELITAKYFNTQRRVRGDDFSRSDVEVLADAGEWLNLISYNGIYLVVECKYRKEIGIVASFRTMAQGKTKIPIMRIGDFILCYLNDFKDVFVDFVAHIQSNLDIIEITNKYEISYNDGKEPKYLRDYLDQAAGYSEANKVDGHCFPLLSLAKANTRGRIVAFHVTSLKELWKKVEFTVEDI
jgi:hypothetical protein